MFEPGNIELEVTVNEVVDLAVGSVVAVAVAVVDYNLNNHWIDKSLKEIESCKKSIPPENYSKALILVD